MPEGKSETLPIDRNTKIKDGHRIGKKLILYLERVTCMAFKNASARPLVVIPAWTSAPVQPLPSLDDPKYLECYHFNNM